MPTYFEELELIEKGEIKLIYFLYGDDLFLQEEAIRSVCQSFIKTGGLPERKVFYGGEKTDDSFIQSLVSVGMFSSRQIVIYKNINQIPISFRKQLLQYFDNPDTNTLLILTADGQKKSKFIESLKRISRVISVWTPQPRSFPSIVLGYLEKKGCEIKPDALDLLVSSTDDTLSHTFSELEKVLVFVGERKSINIDDIRFIVGGSKKYQMSDFIDAIGNGDLYNSINICITLIETGIKAPYFVSSLYNYFVNVWAYPEVHMNASEGKPWMRWKITKYGKGYENYKNSDFGFIIDRLTDVDLKSKSVNLSTEELMIPLLYEIVSAKKRKDGK